MKQKKNATPASSSSVTLLDFFKAKPIETPIQRKKRPQDKHNTRPKPRSSPQEIIVIDSDSEDDAVEIVEYSGAKRRRLSPPLAPSGPLAANRSSGTANTGVEGRNTKRGATSPITENSRDALEPFGAICFGTPVLLQSPEDNSIVLHGGKSGHTNVSFTSFHEAGVCNNLPSSTTLPTTNSNDNETNYPRTSNIQSIKSEETLVDIDLTLDDWGTGDDELGYEALLPQEEADTKTMTDIPPDLGGVTDDFQLDESTREELEETYESTTRNKPFGSNAFSVLMTSFKENEAWKEATEADDHSRPSKENGGRRKAPFYKVLQGMPIAVDAFRYGKIPDVMAYFLTHAHSDHYTNLSSSWKHGPIYCSEGTANLITHMLSVDKEWVHPLPMDTPTVIPNTQGVTVTLIEANHCPGSCLFFFEGRQTVNAGDTNFKSPYVGSPRTFRYLHCGDFRASPQHVMHPAVKGKEIDHVYLDTTYLDPKYTFPPQPLVISACADLATKLAKGEPIHESGTISSWFSGAKGKGKEPQKPILFVIGTYSIGKERVVKAVAQALGSKIYCDKRKAALLRCQADPELHSLLTSNPSDAVVHLLPLGMITSDKLKPYLERFETQFSKIVGFRPTGWTYVQPSGTDQMPSVNTILTRTIQKTFTFEDLKPTGKSTTAVQMFPVPYSEHSSFYELTCFAMSLNWKKIIATVNVGSERSRGKMAKWFSKWEAERRRRGKVEVVQHRHAEYW